MQTLHRLGDGVSIFQERIEPAFTKNCVGSPLFHAGSLEAMGTVNEFRYLAVKAGVLSDR